MRYFVKNGGFTINVFSDNFTFPNKDGILALYNTDRKEFERRIDEIKTQIKFK